MTRQNLGYPLSYGDSFTPEMSLNNRKQAIMYSTLLLWFCGYYLKNPSRSNPDELQFILAEKIYNSIIEEE